MLTYLVYKFTEFIVIVLTYPLAYALAVSTARLWYAAGSNVGIIKKNISRALNLDIRDPEVHRIAVKVFTNWGKNIIDFLRHRIISRETLKSRVSLEGVEYLDEALKSINSDYEAKRYMNMTINMPRVHKAEKGLFYKWLKTKNKLGGQHKVPRLSNQRVYLEELMVMYQS